jgi:hypothetical protein
MMGHYTGSDFGKAKGKRQNYNSKGESGWMMTLLKFTLWF